MFIFEQIHRQRSINPRCVICRGCPAHLILGITHMDAHPITAKQKSQSEPVAMLWDGQNVHLKQKEAEFLVAFAKSKGRLEYQKFYYNSQHKNQVDNKNRLQKLGFQGIDVPDRDKNSADKQLVFDCIKRVAIKPSPDIIILVLGDKDFAGLINVLITLGKTVIVFARRDSASKKLIKLVGEDNFHDVDELPSLCGGLKAQLNNPQQLSIETNRLSA